MRYTASLQACHRSSPLREKSGSSQVRDSSPATGMSGNLRGERYLSCYGASAVRRRAMGGWTTGRSCMAPLDGHWRSQPLNGARHSRTNTETTAPASFRTRMQPTIVGIKLAQTTRAGCCEHPAQLSTPLTWGEKSLTNVNLSRPHCLFNHSYFFARRARARQRLVTHNRTPFRYGAPQSIGAASSLLDHASGARPRN
jgi:hypothetical protein